MIIVVGSSMNSLEKDLATELVAFSVGYRKKAVKLVEFCFIYKAS
jgi:hypothetical protein